jgi:site-specific DNA recombinase
MGETPRCTGRQVRNKQPKSEVLIDVKRVALGHTTKQTRNDRARWIWSEQPALEALIDGETLKRAQPIHAARGPADQRSPQRTPSAYALCAIVRCGICGRKMQGSWNNGRPNYLDPRTGST